MAKTPSNAPLASVIAGVPVRTLAYKFADMALDNKDMQGLLNEAMQSEETKPRCRIGIARTIGKVYGDVFDEMPVPYTTKEMPVIDSATGKPVVDEKGKVQTRTMNLFDEYETESTAGDKISGSFWKDMLARWPVGIAIANTLAQIAVAEEKEGAANAPTSVVHPDGEKTDLAALKKIKETKGSLDSEKARWKARERNAHKALCEGALLYGKMATIGTWTKKDGKSPENSMKHVACRIENEKSTKPIVLVSLHDDSFGVLKTVSIGTFLRLRVRDDQDQTLAQLLATAKRGKKGGGAEVSDVPAIETPSTFEKYLDEVHGFATTYAASVSAALKRPDNKKPVALDDSQSLLLLAIDDAHSALEQFTERYADMIARLRALQDEEENAEAAKENEKRQKEKEEAANKKTGTRG